MKKLKNKVGPWVQEDEFWNREKEVKRFIELLDESENLLIVAPRRIGKTSLLKESLRQIELRKKDYPLFLDVQDCKSPEDFIVSLSMATKAYQNLWDKTKDVFHKFIESIWNRIDTVGYDELSIKFREGVMGDWQTKGEQLFLNMAMADRPVILAVDEFPVMINRFLRRKDNKISDQSKYDTEIFLSWIRQQMGSYQKKIRWVVCGSIGLEPVLSQADLSHTIGHLRPFPLMPWSDDVAISCLRALAENYDLDFQEEVVNKMLLLIGCNIPHYVQMFFGHVLDYCRIHEIKDPSCKNIQDVYDHSMLSIRGHAELADLEERLRRVLGHEPAILAMEILTETAVKGYLTDDTAQIIARVSAASFQNDSTTMMKQVLRVLEHDGYISPVDSAKYEFVSKLLRDWWKRRFGFGYIPAEKRGIES